MSHFEEALLRRSTGARIMLISLALGAAGILPLLFYVQFGPSDGNPGGSRQVGHRTRQPGKNVAVFKALGVVVLVYAFHAARSGRVYAKAGIGGRMVSRKDSPEYFWIVTVIYFALAIALLTIF